MQPSTASSPPLSARLRAAGEALELAPAHVVALLVLASCACAGLVALWWTARPASPASTAAPGLAFMSPAPTAQQSSAASGPVIVHVSGAVRREGVHELSPGSRVVDAIEAAGGARRSARTEQLNLARTLRDGEQIHLPDAADLRAASGTASGPGTASGGGAGSPGPVNLNHASATELEELPGVGPVLAERIIAHRDTNGGFTAVEDLMQVSGIGEKTFAALKDLVTV